MEELCKKFYTKLFASCIDVAAPEILTTKKHTPPVRISEVRNAAFQMKSGKAPGNDGIRNELLKAGGHELWKATARFNRYLPEKTTPSNRGSFCFIKRAIKKI
ncbi:unnamed protein product [Soboliphyme baturini]|uniref:Reverse transcriptase domain-containing protein n=1 Tax=Soboliphyme baturini TaxID=241478 RepID=A0A183J1F8_9BILA|nr:unnamed protein product [Soboliphyme baturini]